MLLFTTQATVQKQKAGDSVKDQAKVNQLVEQDELGKKGNDKTRKNKQDQNQNIRTQ